MAILDGGIFSRPRGKTGGIVFGAARTRQGKQVTSRLLVPPSNPKTPAQLLQRGIFSSSLDIVRRIGSAIYRIDWNRAIGQLPGFQSMQSVFMNQMNSLKVVSLVNPINLGILHFPDTVISALGDPGQLVFSLSAEDGDNGTQADKYVGLAVAKNEADRILPTGVVVSTGGARTDQAVEFNGLVTGTVYDVYIYVKGEGSASGLLSVANPFEATVS